MSVSVLVLDDHMLICQAMRQLIELEPGWRCVDTCSEIAHAADLLASQPIDLMICDLRLSRGNVLKFIGDQKQKHATRFLVSSGLNHAVYAPICQHAGASGFIPKSWPPTKLLEASRHATAADFPFDGWVGIAIEVEFLGCRLRELSQREWEILLEFGKGKSTKEIARMLFLSEKTVESHRLRIKQKISVDSKDHLVQLATELSEVLAD